MRFGTVGLPLRSGAYGLGFALGLGSQVALIGMRFAVDEGCLTQGSPSHSSPSGKRTSALVFGDTCVRTYLTDDELKFLRAVRDAQIELRKSRRLPRLFRPAPILRVPTRVELITRRYL